MFLLCLYRILTMIVNRKDAIITTFELTQRSFKTEMQETEDEIQILVHRPVSAGSTNPRNLLGYILFKRNKVVWS